MSDRLAAPLRSCAVGGGHHLGHNSTSFGGRYLCPKHQRETFYNFDPQPCTHQIGELIRNRVRFIDGGRGDAELIVIARDGDQVTVKVLGFPDLPAQTVPLAALWPGWYPNYSRGCGR